MTGADADRSVSGGGATGLGDGPESPASPAAPHRGSRRKARKYALDVVFAADLQDIDPMAIVAQGLLTNQAALPDYSRHLIETVTDRRPEIDELIATHLKSGWSLPRMPRVDRCLARVALAELLTDGAPPEVAISEAVALAAELSTAESPHFLSGLLGALARDLPLGPADTARD